VTITRKNLLNLVVVATTAVTSSRIIEAVRLKSVELWTNPPALGSAPMTCSVEWIGSNAPSTIISDTTMGVLPAHVLAKPPPNSSNRWWSMSGTDEADPLFTLVVPSQTVCDVRVNLRLVDSEAPVAGDVPAGATVGQVYYDFLDGIGGQWNPISVSQLP